MTAAPGWARRMLDIGLVIRDTHHQAGSLADVFGERRDPFA